MKRAFSLLLLFACSDYDLVDNNDDVEEPIDTEVQDTAPPQLAPVALAGAPLRIKRWEPAVLDGSSSYDPDGEDDALSYAWEVLEAPEDADYELLGDNAVNPELQAETLGVYVLALVVTDPDGLVSRNTATTTVEVMPYETLYVELDWEVAELDLDLHLVHPDGSYYDDPLDCHFGNPEPDWGVAGLADDDPELVGDDEGTEKTESILLPRPEEGVYTLYVHYYNQRDATVSDTSPTLQINAEGYTLETLTAPELESAGEVWVVGTLDWSTLTFTEDGSVADHADLGGPTYNE